MEQMNIAEELKVTLNYEAKDLSRPVRELRPVLFKDGPGYSCLLGPDLDTGIIGSGNTPAKALQDWERSLYQRIDRPTEDDATAQYAKDQLSVSKNDVG
ncbi:hypothetical protein [Pedobacter sp. GR22-10]|uniref:hypothetical protein n=1 Tax=Pedobacter sp. GR22-10 TaxID=2994472 RepID=UPI0022479C1E|nr:hypothetical protein [Pedobacter sp. GR22-10]MCX2429879.1 hypothetical protein [Pedobacter sp. GR22-10]